MFKKFFILNQRSEKYRFLFPDETLFQNVIEEPFLFPCSDIRSYDHGIFVVVFTEVSGDHNFLVSNYIDDGSACVCFQSEYGWFELLYAAMRVVIQSQLYLSDNQRHLEEYLNSLTVLPSPMPGLVIYIPGSHPYDIATKVVVPTKIRQKPFSSFISELHSRLQFEDWIIIFESLLLENWIVFHSRHLDRVSSCIFAAISLLFPLEWVHLIFPCLSEASINCLGCPSPYIAGVHSCLIEKVIPFLSSGAVIVDIDEGIINFLTSEESTDEDRLPKSLMNFLWRHWSSCDMKLVTLKRRINIDNSEEDNALSEIVSGFLQVIAFLLGKYNKCESWDSTSERFCVDNELLSSSRGETFQPFIRRLLQSQMVHQFLDEKVNKKPMEKRGSLNISLNDIDDFEEACQTMEKWQFDIYTDTFANMASKSKRKINVLANKVLDIAKKAELGNKSNVNDARYQGLYEREVKIMTAVTTTIHKSQEDIFKEKVKKQENWIKFDDNSPNLKVEQPWESEKMKQTKDLLIFDEMCDVATVATPSNDSNIHGIIRDFDPLFQT